jgi:opacity protein-like surface antigen
MAMKGLPLRLARAVGGAAVLAVAIAGAAPIASAQQESELERSARLQRRGAGLRAGAWAVQDLSAVSGARDSRSPAFEGYFEKGLDLHLAWENTLGVWRRTQSVEQSGTLGSSSERVASYIVPMFTALKLYPLTRPEHSFEPYLNAGLGLAVAVEDRETSSGGLFGGASGTGLVTGFGLKAGVGFDWRFTPAFGVTVGGRYQWVKFTQEVSGDRTFRGFGADAGLIYRFQYR